METHQIDRSEQGGEGGVLEPMGFGEYFSYAWWLVRGSGPLLLALTLGLLTLLSIGYMWSQVDALATWGRIMEATRDVDWSGDPEAFSMAIATAQANESGSIGGTIISLVLTFVLFAAQVVAALAGWSVAWHERVDAGGILTKTFSRAIWAVIAQTIVLGIVVTLGAMAISALLIFLVFVADVAGLIIGGVILLLALTWVLVTTSLRVHQVAIEERGPVRGVIASIALVRPYLMRTFALLAVWGVVLLGLFILLDALVNGGAFLEFVLGFPRMVDSETPGRLADGLAALRSAVGTPFIIGGGLLYALGSYYFFNLLTALYVDLRVRRGDFTASEDEAAVVI